MLWGEKKWVDCGARYKEINLVNNLIKEIWKNIEVDIGPYSISNCGQVKNYKTGRILKSKIINKYGHLSVNLSKNGITKTYRVHRLVLEYFIGPCPVGMECRHLDGNPHNNRLDNLKWGTRTENQQDRKLHGTNNYFFVKGHKYNIGSKCAWSTLNEKQVRIIKYLLKTNYLMQREIAKIFDVRPNTISSINIGENWKHVKLI